MQSFHGEMSCSTAGSN